MHHRLLVTPQDVRQRFGLLDLGLQQRLADTSDVAVTEDSEAAGEELLLIPVGFGVLRAEEFHHRLRHGQPDGSWHAQASSTVCERSLGSTAWDSQVLRTHAWSGWSVIFQARSTPG